MKINGFVSGLTTGVVIGSALYFTGANMMNKKNKKTIKNSAGKALHAMGDIVENIASGIMD